MKRMHIHVSVENLDQSINFYNILFGAQPSKIKADYANWVLDDPRINFAISTRSGKTGIDHLGIQVDQDSELDELRTRLNSTNISVFDEGETVCCYARSDKSWVKDPTGIAWEAYNTMEDVQLFSSTASAKDGACCTPKTKGQPDCCEPSEKISGCGG